MGHSSKAIGEKLSTKTQLHLLRKIWHMSAGFLVVFIYQSGLPRESSVLCLAIALAICLFGEFARLKMPAINVIAVKLGAAIMRRGEESKFSGVPYYIASALLVIALMPKPVAVLSLLFLAFGDPMASFFGILYGHNGPKFSSGKTLIGSLASVAICTVMGFVFLSGSAPSLSELVIVSILGGMAGGMAELLPFNVDDNFVIPVFSGLCLWFLFIVFGFPTL